MELVITTAAEVSDCNGDVRCFQPIFCRVFLSGTIYFAVKNNAVVSASAADDTIYFMICTMANNESFHLEILSFSDRKGWALALLLDFD